MPDNYFRAFDVEEIVAHLELFRSFWSIYICATSPLSPRRFAWEAHPEQGHSVVSFCTWDGQQLLANIAGSFAVVPSIF